MHNLKIGIVEDDLIIAEALIEMLQESGYTVTEPATRYSEAIAMIEADKPDLLLLDINLPGRLNGIAIARTIRESFNIPFIFLTANTDFDTIERVKEVQPSAFLAKPVTKAQLYAAVEVALATYVTNSRTENDESEQKPDFLFIKEGYGYKKIKHDELIFVQAEQNYLHLQLANGKNYALRQTLGDFYESMSNDMFIRTHRGFIAAIDKIKEVSADELLMEQGYRVPISKTYRADVMKALRIK